MWTAEWPGPGRSGRRWFYGWTDSPHGEPTLRIATILSSAPDQTVIHADGQFLFKNSAHGLWGDWLDEPVKPRKDLLVFGKVHMYEITAGNFNSAVKHTSEIVFAKSEEDAKRRMKYEPGKYASKVELLK